MFADDVLYYATQTGTCLTKDRISKQKRMPSTAPEKHWPHINRNSSPNTMPMSTNVARLMLEKKCGCPLAMSVGWPFAVVATSADRAARSCGRILVFPC